MENNYIFFKATWTKKATQKARFWSLQEDHRLMWFSCSSPWWTMLTSPVQAVEEQQSQLWPLPREVNKDMPPCAYTRASEGLFWSFNPSHS